MSLLATLLGPGSGRKRRVLALILALAAAGGLALAADKPAIGSLRAQPIEITARPLAGFDKSRPETSSFGRLEWRGGLVLSADSPHFGGWSGLAIDETGRSILAVSDAGTWLKAEIAYQGKRPHALTSARLGPLLALNKAPLTRGRDRDPEGLTLAEGTLTRGTALIAFEGNDRIGRFAIDANGLANPASYVKLPPEVTRVKSVDGVEAVAILKGGPHKGSMIAFREHPLPGEKDHAGWLWVGGEPKRLSLTDIGGFNITDAASTPDGGLFILERRFRWNEGVRMRLRQVAAAELKPGASITGETLLEADLNQEIDNMEGLAVHTEPDGRTILTLISDDNFNSLLQRTVLLQFALAPSSVAKATR